MNSPEHGKEGRQESSRGSLWKVCRQREGKWRDSQGENGSGKRTECLWAQLLGLDEGAMADMPFKETILMATVKIHCRILIVKIYLYVCGIKH